MLNGPKTGDDDRKEHQSRIAENPHQGLSHVLERFLALIRHFDILEQKNNDEQSQKRHARGEKIDILQAHALPHERHKSLAAEGTNIDHPVEKRKPPGAIDLGGRLAHRTRNQRLDEGGPHHDDEQKKQDHGFGVENAQEKIAHGEQAKSQHQTVFETNLVCEGAHKRRQQV